VSDAIARTVRPCGPHGHGGELAVAVLVKNMAWGALAAGRAEVVSHADMYSCLGILALDARREEGGAPRWACDLLAADWTSLPLPVGSKNVSPLVLPDGSILSTAFPGDAFIRFAAGDVCPQPLPDMPGSVHGKELCGGEVWLLAKDGEHLAIVDAASGTTRRIVPLGRAGVRSATALCRRDQGAAVLSWKTKSLFFLDEQWGAPRAVSLPWADFLMSPVGVGQNVLVVNTPTSAVGDGEILRIDDSGRVRCVVDGLDCPTGMAVAGRMIICADRRGVGLYALEGGACPSTFIPYARLVPGVLEDETVSAGTIRVQGEFAYLFVDISPKDICDGNRTGVLRISLSSLERFWHIAGAEAAGSHPGDQRPAAAAWTAPEGTEIA